MANKGGGQQAECMRCGAIGLARNLIKDGRNPRLLVLSTCGCWDAKHEAERPFVPKTTEGKARFPLSPELFPPVEIELESDGGEGGAQAWDDDAWDNDAWDAEAWTMGGNVLLSWNRPTTVAARIERYEIFRSALGASFELAETNTIEYSDFMEVENEPEEYTDEDADAAGVYRYYVEGVTGNGRRHRSNTVTVEVS